MYKSSTVQSVLRRSLVKSNASRIVPASLQSCCWYQQKKNLSTAPEHNHCDDAAFDLVRPHDDLAYNQDLCDDDRVVQEASSSQASEHSSPSSLLNAQPPRTSVLMELTDRVGVLHDVLKYYWKYDVNITHIESRPHKLDPVTGKVVFDFFLDSYVQCVCE